MAAGLWAIAVVDPPDALASSITVTRAGCTPFSDPPRPITDVTPASQCAIGGHELGD